MKIVKNKIKFSVYKEDELLLKGSFDKFLLAVEKLELQKTLSLDNKIQVLKEFFEKVSLPPSHSVQAQFNLRVIDNKSMHIMDENFEYERIRIPSWEFSYIFLDKPVVRKSNFTHYSEGLLAFLCGHSRDLESVDLVIKNAGSFLDKGQVLKLLTTNPVVLKHVLAKYEFSVKDFSEALGYAMFEEQIATYKLLLLAAPMDEALVLGADPEYNEDSIYTALFDLKRGYIPNKVMAIR